MKMISQVLLLTIFSVYSCISLAITLEFEIINQPIEFEITGQIININTNSGIPDLDIEAWDNDIDFDDQVGTANTDFLGRFSILFNSDYFFEPGENALPDIYFKIYSNTQLLLTTYTMFDSDQLGNLTFALDPNKTNVVMSQPDPAPIPLPPTLPMLVTGILLFFLMQLNMRNIFKTT